jgi:S-adenosylmethionine-diacylglycerol 3-amino-3-carboxypropyl transferase
MNLSSGLTHSGLETKPASWVLEAARRPVAFAQVREDAALDQWVVEQLDAGAEVIMVASGGCSAAALATMPKVARFI